MKKLFAILALAIGSSAFAADGFTLEQQNNGGVNGGSDQTSYVLTARHDLNKTFTADVSFTSTVTEVPSAPALGNRLEVGLTGSKELFGPIKGYTRVGYGEKYSNTTHFAYYSIQPGVTFPIVGQLTGNVGWRYRSSTNPEVRNDQTHTMRYGVSYPLTKNDVIGVRYDRLKGDSEQKTVAFNYTRNF